MVNPNDTGPYVKRVDPNKKKKSNSSSNSSNSSSTSSKKSKGSDPSQSSSSAGSEKKKKKFKLKTPKGMAKDKAKEVIKEKAEEIQNKAKEEPSKRKKRKRNKRRAALAGKAGYQAAKFSIMYKMSQFMRMLGAMAVQGLVSAVSAVVGLVQGAVAAIASALSTIGSAIMGAVSAIGSFISSAFSVSMAVGSTIAATAVTVVVAGGALLVGVGVTSVDSTRQSDMVIVDCVTDVDALAAALEGDEAQMVEENGRKIFSVLKSLGVSDAGIAGVIGNWHHESGIDPSAIEGSLSVERYTVGPKKKEILENHDSYTRNLIAGYEARGLSINKRQYQSIKGDGTYFMGIGLPQFTPGDRYTSVAESMGYNWWDLDFQLAFILAKGTELTTGREGGSKYFTNYIDKTKDMTPWEAGYYFTETYEGNTTHGMSDRKNKTDLWAEKIKSLTPDTAYADSILALAEELGAEAGDKALKKAKDNCVSTKTYDNSTLAMAAVSYAHTDIMVARSNEGTELYQRLRAQIFPSDTWTGKSCDRGVATAVRWSGVDDDYPAGSTATQHVHCNASPRWEKVGTSCSMSYGELQPGDVFLIPRTSGAGHTFMYVGTDLIKQVHGNKAPEGADTIEASLNSYSPCTTKSSKAIFDRGGIDFISSRGCYDIFRMVDPMNSPKYTSMGR